MLGRLFGHGRPIKDNTEKDLAYVQSGQGELRLGLLHPVTGKPGFKTAFPIKKQNIFCYSEETFVKRVFAWDFVLVVKLAFYQGWLNLKVGRLISEAKSSLSLTSHLQRTFKCLFSHWTRKCLLQKSFVDGRY